MEEGGLWGLHIGFTCVSTAHLPRLRGASEGPFCMLCHVEETATGDAREDAKLKTARAAREAGTVRNIMGILRHSEGVQLSRWDALR